MKNGGSLPNGDRGEEMDDGLSENSSMSDDGAEILVLRDGAPGLSAKSLGEALMTRLPDHDVQVAVTPEQERTLIRYAQVVAGNGLSESLLRQAPVLKYYAHVSSGVDNLPLDELTERGVAVTNAAGLMPSIAEQVLGYLLVFARDFCTGWRRQRRREWRHYQPGELRGSTVTIVGLGSIGLQVLDRLSGFGVETIGIRHTPSKGGPADEIIGYETDDVHSALARTDYLVLTCPLTELTEGLVDQTALDTLPPDAVVVNVARGPVIDTDALVAALQSNRIRGAALDVTDPEPLPADHPLWDLSNVLITPHNAGANPHHWERVADRIARNVERAEQTGAYDDLENQIC